MAVGGTEHEHQSALASWWRFRALTDERFACIFAVPNGFRGDPAKGKWMLEEGLEPGVPDVVVLVPKRDITSAGWEYITCPGLLIEMKAPYKRKKRNPTDTDGYSDEQIEWRDRLRRQGYKVVGAWDWIEAKAIICDYFGVKDE